MKKYFFTYVLLAFFLLGVAYVVLTLSTGNTNLLGKAAGSGVFTPANSYLFASPLSVRTGDRIRVTAFALDGQGKGVPNRSVSVGCLDAVACQKAGVGITEIQPMTDTLGQAVFDVTAGTPGKYELQAVVNGTPVPQTVTVIFQ